ncbi:MAG: RNA-directed DNA polymerase [Candidatus Methanofastidiosa archaeon]|nr:RNA-directed DNA polymerase [Candidatus Methanofastidiosa archaeon]
METNPIYKGKQISTIQDLSEILNVEVNRIKHILYRANSFYIENPQPKDDGTMRMTYIIKPPLQQIQERIKDNIFSCVEFPHYLMGGIRDEANPRDHIRNAKIHSGKKWLISLDIKNYFPSIKNEYVYFMWRKFFGFSDEVSRVLTRLTTYNGFLPQGSKTSSGIANLLLWDKEPHFVDSLNKQDFVYTRFVDDITISSTKLVEKEMVSKIIVDMKHLLRQYDLKLKGKKTKFQTRSQKMTVNKVTVNGKKPTISSEERNNIRLEVHLFEKKADNTKNWNEIDHDYYSLMGKLNYIKKVHSAYAEKLISRLEIKREEFYSKNYEKDGNGCRL